MHFLVHRGLGIGLGPRPTSKLKLSKISPCRSSPSLGFDRTCPTYETSSTVTRRPSPLTEAVIWVYWNDAILCCALADEFCYEDGTYRPYWFPYPRLGE